MVSRVRADPAEAHPAPDALADRADGDDVRTVALSPDRERSGLRLAREAELAHGLVDEQHGAVRRGERLHAITLRVGHRAAGRVVKVGHEVGERGRRAGHDLLEHVVVPSRISGDGHRDQSSTGSEQRFDGVRVARRLDERPVATGEQGARDEGDGVLGSERDHDLVGARRQPAR